MRRQEVVMTTCVGAAILIAVAMSSHSEGSSQAETDYRDIAAQLVQRGNLSLEGSLTFRQYKFLTSAQDFDALSNILLDSQSLPGADVRSAAEAWINARMPEEREAWSGGCSYLGPKWRMHQRRVPGLDTALATLQATAYAANAEPAPIVSDVVTHVNGEVMTVIEDSRAVITSPRIGHRHPAVPIDISLASWQEAIDLGANIPGQEIHGSIEGARHSILYVNNASDGSWGAAEYVFRDDLDWAPAEVRSFDAEGTDARFVYGYDLSDSSPVTRPAVVAQGELKPSGELDVVVWIIDSWIDSCTPGEVGLRLPPVRLEINYMQSEETPVVAMQEPAYLQNVNACQKAVVAITNVAITIGSELEETDFDCDGYVTLGDLDAAQQTFSGASPEL